MSEATRRLNAVARLDLADEFVSLVARALVLGHPHADFLATVSLTSLAAYSDETLAGGAVRLKAWIAEQGQQSTAGGGELGAGL
jgi:hypothetical protein